MKSYKQVYLEAGAIKDEPLPTFELMYGYDEDDLIPSETQFTYQQSAWKPVVDGVANAMQWVLKMLKYTLKILDSPVGGVVAMIIFNVHVIPEWSFPHTLLLNFVLFCVIDSLNKMINE